MTDLTVLIPPAGEAVSLAQAKAYLRIGHAGEDAFITGLIGQAAQRLEQAAGLVFVTRTLRRRWNVWPETVRRHGAALRPGPVTALEAVRLHDGEGGESDLTGRFQLVCGRLLLQPWSVVPGIEPGGWIDVEFVAGHGAPEAVPNDLQQAVLSMIGYLYFTRNAVNGPERDSGDLPADVAAALNARREVRI